MMRLSTNEPETSPRARAILSLRDEEARSPAVSGGKAAALAELASSLPVPAGFVVTTSATAGILRTGEIEEPVAREILAAFAALGGPVAVRSSAVAEDTALASYAGMYETFLDMNDAEGVLEAVTKCVASVRATRVEAYRDESTRDVGIAVLVQRMVDAEVAGVAFTADPVTGDRGTVVLSAVRGLGEKLVSGVVSAEEWRERDGELVRLREAGVLTETRAKAVVALARRVAEKAGAPRDIEWAVTGDDVFLLQARPITALPDEIRWEAPPGGWIRNFRIGEWLGAPVSPSFATWGLPTIEDALHDDIRRICGFALPKPSHVVVNGWYFYGGLNLGSALAFILAIPRMLLMLFVNFREFAAITPPIAHLGFDYATARWRHELAPRYRALSAEAEAAVKAEPVESLPALVDRVAKATGEQFGSVVGVAGYAAKAEMKLATFWKQHLADVEGSWLDLVREGDLTAGEAHDVQSLDWMHALMPTAGIAPDPETRDRVIAAREATYARARAALADRPALAKKLEALTNEARRAHRVREEQSRLITLPWPALRSAFARMGQSLVERGVLRSPDQIYFLEKTEILAAIDSPKSLAAVAEGRQLMWQRQRKLAAPLKIGKLPAMQEALFAQIDRLVHGTEPAKEDELRGMPGSPGSITGKVRVLHQVEELDRLLPGEVLVAPVTTPGWTPAFLRAAAVVTDSGSIASHASIVAREYGLPAVVATGDATSVLRDGDLVTVDGSRGRVTCLSRSIRRTVEKRG